MTRQAERKRSTKETQVEVSIDLDGQGTTAISTGIPFYDHMLDQLGKHGGFNLKVQAKGDLEIDTHHTVEDVAITLGEAIEIALDLSGRAFVHWEVEMPECLPLGDPAFDPQLAEHAISSFANAAGITLHVTLRRGKNVHHIIEASFKGLARCLRDAVKIESDALPSTKGKL